MTWEPRPQRGRRAGDIPHRAETVPAQYPRAGNALPPLPPATACARGEEEGGEEGEEKEGDVVATSTTAPLIIWNLVTS